MRQQPLVSQRVLCEIETADSDCSHQLYPNRSVNKEDILVIGREQPVIKEDELSLQFLCSEIQIKLNFL